MHKQACQVKREQQEQQYQLILKGNFVYCMLSNNKSIPYHLEQLHDRSEEQHCKVNQKERDFKISI